MVGLRSPVLIYSAITSLDGFVADRDGDFAWSAPDEEVHSFVNDLERPVGTYLYGRRLYEVMKVWDSSEAFADEPSVIREYAEIWQSADKIAFTSTLDSASTRRTRLEKTFEPEAIRTLKANSSAPISIGGPELAAVALRAGLVDEIRVFLSPVIVGGGNPALPDDVRLDLELLDEKRFGNGVVFVRYRSHNS